MRRLFVAPLHVYEQHRQLFSTHLTTHWLGLVDPNVAGELERWKAAGQHVVISTEFLNEGSEDKWSSHPHVMDMPHPIWDGQKPVTVARELTENDCYIPWGSDGAKNRLRMTGKPGQVPPLAPLGWGGSLEGEEKVETDGVDHLIMAGFGVAEADTIVHVHQKLEAVHPAFKLRAFR